MDPNALLEGMRAALAGIDATPEGTEPEIEDINTVLDGFEAMDEWLSGGGFLPTDWEGHTKR